MPEVFASFDTNIILDLFIPSYHKKIVENLIEKLKNSGIKIKISGKVIEEVLKVGHDVLKEAEQIVNEMIEYLQNKNVKKLSLEDISLLELFFSNKFRQYKREGREREYNKLVLYADWIVRKIEEILVEKRVRLSELKTILREYVATQYRILQDNIIYFINKTATRIESRKDERLVNELKSLGFGDYDSKILSSLLFYCYDNNEWGVFVTRDYNLIYLNLKEEEEKKRRRIPLTITTPTFALLSCLLIIQTEKRSYRKYFEVQASDRIKSIVTGPTQMYA